MNLQNKDKNVQEDFCPSCLVMPLAFVGTGAVVAGNTVSNKHKKWKKGLLISGVITLVILIALVFYVFVYKGKCKTGTCPL